MSNISLYVQTSIIFSVVYEDNPRVLCYSGVEYLENLFERKGEHYLYGGNIKKKTIS